MADAYRYHIDHHGSLVRGDLDVAIATNAGFAAVADRPLPSEDAQHAKFRLVETVARYHWGNEI